MADGRVGPVILARHALDATLPPEAVWARWTEVSSWPAWDASLERASAKGAFQAGTALELKRRQGALLRPVLVRVEEGRSFAFQEARFGTRVTTIHEVEASPLGSRITQRVEVAGWAAWLVAFLRGPALRAALPEALRGLVRHVAQAPAA